MGAREQAGGELGEAVAAHKPFEQGVHHEVGEPANAELDLAVLVVGDGALEEDGRAGFKYRGGVIRTFLGPVDDCHGGRVERPELLIRARYGQGNEGDQGDGRRS